MLQKKGGRVWAWHMNGLADADVRLSNIKMTWCLSMSVDFFLVTNRKAHF